MLHVDCLNRSTYISRIWCFYSTGVGSHCPPKRGEPHTGPGKQPLPGLSQPEPRMPKKKQTTRAGTSATKLRATAELTKRIEQWSRAIGKATSEVVAARFGMSEN
jgi:hypothetical protein